jgi:hypothetical protein
MDGGRTVDERIRWLLDRARDAELRGEWDLARTFRAMARDLGPAPASRVAM